MRSPVAIGFYPGDKIILKNNVRKFLVSDKKINAFGIISPHAGYDFSGSVAGKVYASSITEKKNFILFSPNHTGYGNSIAISNDEWLTPLGRIETNKELIKKFNLKIDETAHKYEHSIEVQLPFLQVLYKNFKIVPICLQHIDIDEIEKIAENVSDSSSFYIASSDFTHFGYNYGYEPISGTIQNKLRWVKNTDMKMIDLICKLKAEEFYNEVIENGYTICGFVPITLIIFVMKNLGARKGLLIDYKTSYEVYPSSSFVSYAGIVFY
ncbi:MAG: AmmeMemoRadiSam system protein B [Candidatus Aenigmatarchaeota archaeon]